MRFLTTVNRLWLVCILAVLKATDISAQAAVNVLVGDLYTLGVTAVPGETYEWAIWSDYALTQQAKPDEVIWHSPNTGPSITVEWRKSGTYYFTVTAVNSNGCMNLKVGLVIVNQQAGITPGISIVADKNPVCLGTLVTFTAVSANEGQYPIYRWRKNGIQTGRSSKMYSDSSLQNGDLISCQLTSSEKLANPVNVYSNELAMTVYHTVAKFSVSGNMSQQNWQLHLLNESRDADYYKWDFGNGQTSGESNPSVTYSSDGTYLIRLIAINKYNCFDTAYYAYEMLFKGLYIPNAFAPGSDVQDANVFKPAGINLKEYRIEVYDSWGHLLWGSEKLDESGRPVETWDGTYKGSPMPQGTYMWKVYAVFRDGTPWTGSDIGHGEGKTMGTVTLIR